ncbi:MAG: hypothetical protein IJC50_01950 [Clostridia bacterium]|nr:hypothetical protein [Clostridia bacterium]
MNANDQKELKKYRDTLLIHLMLGVCGMAIAVYIYKYTDLLSGIADGYVYICRLDARELFMRYYTEARYMIVLFLIGFTIFAVPAAIIFSVLRGFVCSVGILRLAAASRAGSLSATHLVFTCVFMALIFGIELVMTAKSVRHGMHLKYIVPRAGELVRDRFTVRYSATFALLCGLLFISVTLVYFAPMLPF